MVLTPHITEKAIALAEQGVYVFEVPMAANKIEVASAVEAAFKVNVTTVNLLIAKGKLKRFRQLAGRRRDTKRAHVRLKSGQTISLFEGAN